MPEHKDITDPNIHEAKGASTASIGQVLTATGSGTATFQALPSFSEVEVGSYRIANSSSTPVALTVAGTYYTITNDSLGAATSSTYGIAGITDIWNEANNQFILSGFSLGDFLLVSVEVDITTTTANTAVDIVLDLGVGDPATSTMPLIVNTNIKSASTTRYVVHTWLAIRTSVIQLNPARIRAKADQTGCTVLAKNFDVGVIKR